MVRDPRAARIRAAARAGQSRAGAPEAGGGLDRPLADVASRVVGDLRAAPCAVVAAAVRTPSGAWLRGAGAAGRLWLAGDAPAATVETPFDLASVAKPFTALTALRLARAGAVALDAPVARWLPALEGTPAGARPLALLLRHRAGLEAHRPLFEPLTRGAPVDPARALADAARAHRAGVPADLPAEGAPVVYSDLGYLIAGAALAAAGGRPLDALIEGEVVAPAGSSAGSARQWRAHDASFDARVAPTEVVPFRGGLVRGAVHDENAWALAGDAACGHAGLFGAADDVLALGEALVEALAGEREDWLGRRTLEEALAPWPGGSHVLGFDTRSGPAPSSGRRFGARTFGHLGFTGTSVWIDPDASLVGVLLTNRVHPTREHVAIRAARPVVYDAIAEHAAAAVAAAR